MWIKNVAWLLEEERTKSFSVPVLSRESYFATDSHVHFLPSLLAKINSFSRLPPVKGNHHFSYYQYRARLFAHKRNRRRYMKRFTECRHLRLLSRILTGSVCSPTMR